MSGFLPEGYDTGTSGITALTGDVTASGTGSVVATITPAGTNGFVLTTVGGVAVWAAAAAGGITALTGDVVASGSGSVVATVEAINGASVPASGALTPGNVLLVSGATTLSYGPLDLSNASATTNTLAVASLTPGSAGFILTTFGSGPGVAQWTTPTAAVLTSLHGDVVTAAGGLGNQAATVEALWGQSLPGSGARTTGNVLQVLNGATALSYAPVNLAGGANFVTGNLPAANVAPAGTNGFVLTTTAGATVWAAPATSGTITALTGDVTASGSGSVAATVARVNGATVPAAGALTTGNVLQVTGVSAVGYAPVNLAGGANFVTGELPVSSVAPAGTNGQVIITGSGATSWAVPSGDVQMSGTGAFTVTQARGGAILFASGTGLISFPAADTGPGLSQATAASSVAPVNMSFLSQAPNATGGSVALNTPGSFVFTVPLVGTTGGTGVYGAISLVHGANEVVRMQSLPAHPTYGAIYMGGVTPSASNFILYSSGTTDTELNSPTGTLTLATGGTGRLTLTSTLASFNGALLGGLGAQPMQFATTASAIAVTSGTSTISAAQSITPKLTVTGSLTGAVTIDFGTNATNGTYFVDCSGVTLGAFGITWKNGTASQTPATLPLGGLVIVTTSGANTIAVN